MFQFTSFYKKKKIRIVENTVRFLVYLNKLSTLSCGRLCVGQNLGASTCNCSYVHHALK